MRTRINLDRILRWLVLFLLVVQSQDKDNIYGMMKVRGIYGTEEERNEQAGISYSKC